MSQSHSKDPHIIWDQGTTRAFSVDHRAFLPSEEFPTPLCDLMIALALAHNDIIDVVTANAALRGYGPYGDSYTPLARRHADGLFLHNLRHAVGIVHELVVLLRENKKWLVDERFQSIFRKLSKDDKKAWGQLLKLLDDSPPSNHPLTKMLAIWRNSLSFHYSAKVLGQVFRQLHDQTNSSVLLAHSQHPLHTRFFFADAVVAAKLLGGDPSINSPTLLDAMKLLTSPVKPIRSLLLAFITRRGYALAQASDASAPPLSTTLWHSRPAHARHHGP